MTKHILPEALKERRGPNYGKTKAKHETTDTQTKNCNRGIALKQSSGKQLGRQPVLLAWNLTLNSDAALNYKYVFVPLSGLHLICVTAQWNTYNQNHRDETKQKVQWRF